MSYVYPGNGASVLKEISFNIGQGEFLLIMGRSGSGKSTLARILCRLVPDFYGGKLSGQVRYKNKDLRDWNSRELPGEIAMLFQESENQIVYNQVERDIAFGLENLGMAPPLMKRRVAEVMDFLNLNGLRHRNPSELSGGEKRKIALAGVLAMKPEVLILDEPGSQLDPVAAEDLLNWLKKLNAEMGTTIILVEQRLDKAFPLVDRVLCLDQGGLVFDGAPNRQPGWAVVKGYPLLPTIPSIMAEAAGSKSPITVKEGREMLNLWTAPSGNEPKAGLDAIVKNDRPHQAIPFIHTIGNPQKPQRRPDSRVNPLLEIRNMHFSYCRRTEFIEDMNINIYRGESVVLLGANGAGKSTLLRLITGILQPQRGSVRVNRDLRNNKPSKRLEQFCAYLPQSVEDFFLGDTVEDEISLSLPGPHQRDVSHWLKLMGLEDFAGCDPRKLSVGEKQRIALACLLASDRDILLLDEPTTGMDIEWKTKVTQCLQECCRNEGKTIITITHDMEFASEIASRVILLHGGEVLADEPADTAFADNLFYVSQALHLFKGFDDSIYKPSQAREFIARLGNQEELRAVVKV